MKKSVFLIIIVIFIGAVVVTNFFGMKIVSYSNHIYIDYIECVNDGKETKTMLDKNSGEMVEYDYLVVYFQPTPEVPSKTIHMDYKIVPADVTNKNVGYYFDNQTNKGFASMDEENPGWITFYKTWTKVEVRMYSEEKTSVYRIVNILCRPPV